MSDLIQYTTADQLSQLYHTNSEKAMRLMDEFCETLRELNDAFGTIGFLLPFDYEVTIEGENKREKIQREMKRNAWRVLVGKLELEKVMSPKRRDQMSAVLIHGNDTADNSIDDWPDITPENILGVLQGYMASADEFLDESIQDVYEFLKPWDRDEYKTNEKNRWKLSNKIIIGYAVECAWSNNFRLNYGERGNRIQTLDTVFHLLDGKGFSKTHHGELYNAVQDCSPSSPYAETDYFKIRCCKNSNLHIEFKRLDLVDEFNFRCGNGNQLPGRDGDPYSRGNDYSQGVQDQPPLAPNGDLNYFKTPDEVCIQMANLAGICDGMTVLEPSAGLGAIAAVVDLMGGKPTCVEVDQDRAQKLRDCTFEAHCQNFLDMKPEDHESYDAVLMNPPFSHKRDVAHIRHAWGFLKPGGVLVAIASSGVQYRQDKVTTEFREWLDTIGASVEELPEDSFKESGTSVNTVIIHAVKEGVSQPKQLDLLEELQAL